mgnify:CR=1 FL=1
MCCEMLIDKKGRIKSYDIFPAVINVRYRLSYQHCCVKILDQ